MRKEFSPPYEGADPTDEVFVAQATAFELASASNTGGSIDPVVLAFALARANELASIANTEMIYPGPIEI